MTLELSKRCTLHAIFHLCIPKKVSQASLLITTKHFQNRIIVLCLELWYSVEKYNSVTIHRCSHFSSQHGKQHISKRNYEITSVQEIHILYCTVIGKTMTQLDGGLVANGDARLQIGVPDTIANDRKGALFISDNSFLSNSGKTPTAIRRLAAW
jgi:hypothetical protein